MCNSKLIFGMNDLLGTVMGCGKANENEQVIKRFFKEIDTFYEQRLTLELCPVQVMNGLWSVSDSC